PPIIRHLAHADLADCVHHVLALRDQNIDLPQLRNDLFRLVSLPCHCSPPGCQRHTSSRTTSMGVDQRAPEGLSKKGPAWGAGLKWDRVRHLKVPVSPSPPIPKRCIRFQWRGEAARYGPSRSVVQKIALAIVVDQTHNNTFC